MKKDYNQDNLIAQIRGIEEKIHNLHPVNPDIDSDYERYISERFPLDAQIINLIFENSEFEGRVNGHKQFDHVMEYVISKYLREGWLAVLEEFEDAECMVLDTLECAGDEDELTETNEVKK